jgi:hypothetical protein
MVELSIVWARFLYVLDGQIDCSIGRARTQRLRIRLHLSGIERGFHSAAFDHSKIQPFCAALGDS